MAEPKEPADLVDVTEAQFFAAVGPRNVHPRAERMRSVWEDQATRSVVGVTTPGYLREGPRRYCLRADIAKSTGNASRG